MRILYDHETFTFDQITPEEFRAMRQLLKDGEVFQDMQRERHPKKLDQQTVTGWDLSAQVAGVKVPGL